MRLDRIFPPIVRLPLWLLSSLLISPPLGRSPLVAGDWPQFRGPEGRGIAQTSGLPAEFGPAKNLLWKTPLPPGHSSPVLTEDRIFLTAFEDEKLYTLCLERETGRVLWRREAPRPRHEEFNPTHGPASPTPVTDGQNVYVFFGDFGLLSYGPDGNERWQMPLGPFLNQNGHGSSPILADGKLVLICDQDAGSYLLALDPADGSVIWKTDRPEVTRGYATPGVFRPTSGPAQSPAQLIVPGSFVIIAYSLETGEKLWWVRETAWQLKCVPIIDGDTIYINGWEIGGDSGQQQQTPPFEEVLTQHDANGDGKLSRNEAADPKLASDHAWSEADLDDDGVLDGRDWNFLRARRAPINNLVAIRPAGRRGDLTDSGVVWRYTKSLPNTSSPLLVDGILYLIKDGGIATSLDPQTGAPLKLARLSAIDKYWASPVAADGKIFMVSEGCAVTVLKPASEWEVLAVNRLDDHCFATPAIADGRLYLRSTKALYCFGSTPQSPSAAAGRLP